MNFAWMERLPKVSFHLILSASFQKSVRTCAKTNASKVSKWSDGLMQEEGEEGVLTNGL